MLFLTNIYDHRRSDAFSNRSILFKSKDAEGQNIEWQEYLKWVNARIIGPPKASPTISAEEMIRQGIIGLYEAE